MQSETDTPDRMVIVSITVPEGLLADVDSHCEAEDLTRSAYLRRLARKDLAKSRRKSPSLSQPETQTA